MDSFSAGLLFRPILEIKNNGLRPHKRLYILCLRITSGLTKRKREKIAYLTKKMVDRTDKIR